MIRRITPAELEAFQWAKEVLITRREIDQEFAEKVKEREVAEGAKASVRKTGEALRFLERLEKELLRFASQTDRAVSESDGPLLGVSEPVRVMRRPR